MPEHTIQGSANRKFLFLQGLSTPLFFKIGKRLEQQGHSVRRINICPGDLLFWPDSRAASYRGRFAGWSSYLSQYLSQEGITDIVLFGDRRPYHRVAIGLAARRSIIVHIFDEGYLRPDWITMESDPSWRLGLETADLTQLAAGLPSPSQHHRVGGGFFRRAIWDIAFHAANMVLRPLFPFYVRHRPHHPLVEGLGWLRRAAKRWRMRQRALNLQSVLARGETDYFLLPLQLDSDFQVRHRSSFSDMGEVMDTVFRSFAAHARPDQQLVVKVHPLDNGLVDRPAQVRKLADKHGLSGRIWLLDGGHLPTLIGASRGVVVLNSTTGLASMHQRKPTFALAQPVYKLPGLVSPGSLDQFWANPLPPRPELVSAFEAVLADRCQVNGSYFTSHGMEIAVRNVMLRLTSGTYPSSVSDSVALSSRHALP